MIELRICRLALSCSTLLDTLNCIRSCKRDALRLEQSKKVGAMQNFKFEYDVENFVKYN
jgi:hypothetical protein